MGRKGRRGRKRHRDHERPTEKESKSDPDTEKHRKTKRCQKIPRDTLSETNKRGMPLSVQIKLKVNGEQHLPQLSESSRRPLMVALTPKVT